MAYFDLIVEENIAFNSIDEELKKDLKNMSIFAIIEIYYLCLT